MAFYVLCDDDSRHEGMTKEQTLAAIAQAIETGSVGDCDTGFITKVKELNGGRYVTFWVGTQAEYNAIENRATNCMYIITDETTTEDIEAALAKVQEKVDDITDYVDRYTDLSPDIPGARNFFRKYKNGIAEAYSHHKQTLNFTKEMGGLFAEKDGELMFVLNHLPQRVVPSFCSVIVEGVEKTDENGNQVKAPNVFAMIGSPAEDRADVGIVSPRVLFVANERAENVTVKVAIHCRWKWQQ